MKKYLFLTLTILLFANFSFAQDTQGDTITTASGLKYIVVNASGDKPTVPGMVAIVHYDGYLLDGKKFDSSRDRNEPLEFVLGEGQVIKGWDEGVALMKIGDKYRFIIPSNLAYGSKGAGNVIPPDATLVFDVEVMGIDKARKSIASEMLMITFEKNIDEAIKRYHEAKEKEFDDYNFKEGQLNELGYNLLQGKRYDDAIKVFELNIKMFPNSANVYDSMGEGCMLKGSKELAILNYKKSLELNPNNDNAKKMLQQLEAK
ncbi:MAG: FKBP-type peptidyl-prolyl cis-trans isomerase [Ignavibacteria bacterium]|nr:FKBP-type peptidyl-prolyl cis-trans isomerase [Ignavibacteria bacterium]